MMVWLFFAIVILTVWHYLWDGILAPSFRAQYRFELFALRDRVRSMRCAGEIDSAHFRFLEDSLNTAVQILPAITMSALSESRRAIQADAALGRRIDERLAYIEQSPNPEVRELFGQAARVIYRAFMTNSGGWYIFLIPALAITIPVNAVSTLVEKLVALTVNDVSKAAPRAFSRAELAGM